MPRPKYKFSVGPGNNSELVRRTFLRRPWWEEIGVEDENFDCHWRQVRSRDLADKVKRAGNKQFLNHHEGLNCICRKSELYRNLKNYFASQSRNVHDIVPVTYIITVGEHGTDMQEFQRHCRLLESKQRGGSPTREGGDGPVKKSTGKATGRRTAGGGDDTSPTESGEEGGGGGAASASTMRGASISPLRNRSSSKQDLLSKDAKLIKPRGAATIPGTGARIAANMAKQKAGNDSQPLPPIPSASGGVGGGKGRNLPGGVTATAPAWGVSKGAKTAKEGMEKKRELLSKWNAGSDWSEKQESNNLWIVKPTNCNRGNGIQVFNDLRAIEANLQKRGNGYTAIVQKYIEKPLLIHGRKFDIRQLVFVDHNMKVYRYLRPYIRTSSTVYDTNNLNDRFVHLTNYSVQKYSDQCNSHEEGNNMNMPQFQKYIDENHGGSGVSVDGQIIPAIENIIMDTMRAVQNKLNPFRDPNTFELYGYDFLIDEDFKVWLLEVNTNPYIGFSSTMLSEIFSGMMEGIFRLVIDVNFPPPSSAGPIEEVEGSDMWKCLSATNKIFPEKLNEKRAPLVSSSSFSRPNVAAAAASSSSSAAAAGGGGAAKEGGGGAGSPRRKINPTLSSEKPPVAPKAAAKSSTVEKEIPKKEAAPTAAPAAASNRNFGAASTSSSSSSSAAAPPPPAAAAAPITPPSTSFTSRGDEDEAVMEVHEEEEHLSSDAADIDGDLPFDGKVAPEEIAEMIDMAA